MSPKTKFLLLIFGGNTSLTAALWLFLQTDYAQREWAYFRNYPHQEMAARSRKTAVAVAVAIPVSIPVAVPRTVLLVPPPRRAVARSGLFLHSDFVPPVTLVAYRTPIDRRPAPGKSAPGKSPQKKSAPLSLSSVARPADWRHAANLGYAAYQKGDYKTAIGYFERALALSPAQRHIRLQLAYAYKIIGRNPQAVRHFKVALDQYADMDAPFALRREVEQLENRFDVTGYIIHRDKSSLSSPLTGPDLSQSQVGLELSYQPPRVGFRNGRRLQIYGRFLSAMPRDDFVAEPDSFQAGFGARIKPFSAHNLILSAERLVKIGDFARNDWMIRAGYSRDHQTDYQAGAHRWWSYSLYLDAALIDPADPDIYLTGQLTAGLNWRLAEGLVLQPRLTGQASWQQDSFQQADLLEAGPGLNLRIYFNETKYEAYRSYIDLTAEYRIKLSGNSVSGSGWVASLIVHF